MAIRRALISGVVIFTMLLVFFHQRPHTISLPLPKAGGGGIGNPAAPVGVPAGKPPAPSPPKVPPVESPLKPVSPEAAPEDPHPVPPEKPPTDPATAKDESPAEPPASQTEAVAAAAATKNATIGKISMLYGSDNPYYEGAVKSHERHAERHGYPSFILRNEIVKGFWNKPLYILSILISELAKPEEENPLKWLMWYDADSIIVNPTIPLETFLPPEGFENIHFLANKDQNGLNTGIFFIRVDDWSVQMLTRTMAFPYFRPEIDPGRSADQEIMRLLFPESGMKEHILWLPRPWINTYEFKHGYEGKKGDFLVHFPGMEQLRWEHMKKWLDIIENHQEDWEVPLEDTAYPERLKGFWESTKQAYDLVKEATAAVKKNENPKSKESITKATGKLKDKILLATDKTDEVKVAVEEVRLAMAEGESVAPEGASASSSDTTAAKNSPPAAADDAAPAPAGKKPETALQAEKPKIGSDSASS